MGVGPTTRGHSECERAARGCDPRSTPRPRPFWDAASAVSHHEASAPPTSRVRACNGAGLGAGRQRPTAVRRDLRSTRGGRGAEPLRDLQAAWPACAARLDAPQWCNRPRRSPARPAMVQPTVVQRTAPPPPPCATRDLLPPPRPALRRLLATPGLRHLSPPTLPHDLEALHRGNGVALTPGHTASAKCHVGTKGGAKGGAPTA